MDRVEYHLERLLPSLELLSSLSLFTPRELQSLTHTRRKHETALISRSADHATFRAYLASEVDFEQLTQLRVRRAGKDAAGNDAVSIRDRGQIRRFQEKHILSIWQRYIAKIGRESVAPYLAYLAFLRQRRMRRVFSTVAAQALSLHPTHASVWTTVADWELNDNLDASAARITLLRGIRLNTPASHPKAKRPAEAAQHQSQSKRKRRRGHNGAKQVVAKGDVTANTAESEDTRTPTFLAAPLPDNTHELIELWPKYFRMELVFLERLRRRWKVLGINGQQHTEAKQGKESGQDDDNDENASDDVDEVDTSAPTHTALVKDNSTAQDKQTARAAQTTAPSRLMSGALPLMIFSAALGLSRSSDDAPDTTRSSSPSLPSEAHFYFLSHTLDVVARFPFSNCTEPADGLRLRESLIDGMFAALASPSSPPSLSPSDRHTLTLLRQRLHLRRLDRRLRGLDSPAIEEGSEGSDEASRALRRASVLVQREGHDSDDGDDDAPTPVPSDKTAFAHLGEGHAVLFVQEQDLESEQGKSAQQPAAAAARTHQVVLAQCSSLLRSCAALVRSRGGSISDRSAAVQARKDLAAEVQRLLASLEAGGDASLVLRMKSVLLAWRALAGCGVSGESEDEQEQERDEDAVHAYAAPRTAHTDPLLPYLAAVMERCHDEVVSQERSPHNKTTTSARLVYLIFRLQVCLYTRDGDAAQQWDDALAAAEAEAGGASLLEGRAQEQDYITEMRAHIWVGRWAAAVAPTVEEPEACTRFWTGILPLPDSSLAGSTTPALSAPKRRAFALMLFWLRSALARPQPHAYATLAARSAGATRRLLLACSARSPEERVALQGLHDAALRVVLEGGCRAGAAPLGDALALWKDVARSSPSAAAWAGVLADLAACLSARRCRASGAEAEGEPASSGSGSDSDSGSEAEAEAEPEPDRQAQAQVLAPLLSPSTLPPLLAHIEQWLLSPSRLAPLTSSSSSSSSSDPNGPPALLRLFEALWRVLLAAPAGAGAGAGAGVQRAVHLLNRGKRLLGDAGEWSAELVRRWEGVSAGLEAAAGAEE